MPKKYKIVFLAFVSILIACKSTKEISNSKDVIKTSTRVNTEPNEEYVRTRKSFSGKLGKNEYVELKLRIEKELGKIIPDGKSILINYNQRAPNCILQRFASENILNVMKNQINLSNTVCNENNAVYFFVYTSDSFFKDEFESNGKFILDKGFFYDTIFTLHENCGGFFILKANGKFVKYYGEDYHTEVKKGLKN